MPENTGFDEVQAGILRIVARPKYKPQKPKAFLRELGLAPEDKTIVRRAIKRLVNAGLLEYGSEHLVKPGPAIPESLSRLLAGDTDSAAPDQEEKPTKLRKLRKKLDPEAEARAEKYKHVPKERFVIGTFRRAASGIGFVRPKATERNGELQPDIYIAAHLTQDAASGDTVSVEVFQEKRTKEKRKTERGKRARSQQYEEKQFGPRGRVVEIIERVSNRFVGTYFEDGDWGYVQVDGNLFNRPIPVGDPSATESKPGDKIVVEMVQYPSHIRDGEAVIVEVLGPHGVPGLDTLLIMRQYELPEHFSEDTLQAARNEVHAFFKEMPDDADDLKVPKSRYDATEETVVTIDPVDARDFDDAISLTKLSNGHWRLGVHIADVSYFVKPGSPIDREARSRATSVYLPDRVIPMLPEVISNSLASLQPGKVRLTKSVYMEFTPDGIRTHTEIHKSAIRSNRRFNYGEVEKFLQNGPEENCDLEPKVVELLGMMRELAAVLIKRRRDRGAIELEMPEVRIDLDEDGKVAGAHLAENGESNRIIEAFMLAANDAVAEYLYELGIPFLHRVHELPSLRKLKTFADFVRSLNIADLDPKTLLENRYEIQKVLDLVKGTREEQAVQLCMLRSMQRAVYSPEDEGHYALASECYCHFTSPIRRYPDLSVHRTLDKLLGGENPKADVTQLVMLGEHCSARERRAEEAERELVKLKMIDYMSNRLGERMEAVVTGIESFGIFVQGVEIPAEGLIRIENLGDDFYRYDRTTQSLTGARHKNRIRLGDRMTVEVVRADPDERVIDFRRVKSEE